MSVVPWHTTAENVIGIPPFLSYSSTGKISVKHDVKFPMHVMLTPPSYATVLVPPSDHLAASRLCNMADVENFVGQLQLISSPRPRLMMAMHCQNLAKPSKKPHAPVQIDFVHVGGRYRVGKLLGSGGSGEPNSDPCLTFH